MKFFTHLVVFGILAWNPQQPQDPRLEGLLREAVEALREHSGRRNASLRSGKAGAAAIGLLHGPVILPEHRSLHTPPPKVEATEIRGTVLDESGARLPGAEVTCSPLKAAAGHALRPARKTVSDGSGRFRFPELPPGRYRVTARLSGFKQTEVRLDPGGEPTVVLKVALEVGTMSDIIVFTHPERPAQVGGEAVTFLSLERPKGFVPYGVVHSATGTHVLGGYSPDQAEPYRSESLWREDLARARRFYEIALDLQDGPQRFVPYLQEMADRMASMEGDSIFHDLSPWERPLALAVSLDFGILREWLPIEGLQASAEASRHANPSQALRIRLDQISAKVAGLEDLGVFQPRHLHSLRPFLEAWLGLHSVHRTRRQTLPHSPRRDLVAVPLGKVRVYLDVDSPYLDIQTLMVDD